MKLYEDIINNPKKYDKKIVNLLNEYERKFIYGSLDYEEMRSFVSKFEKLGILIDFNFTCEIDTFQQITN